MKWFTYILLTLSLVANYYLYNELERTATDEVAVISSSISRSPALPRTNQTLKNNKELLDIADEVFERKTPSVSVASFKNEEPIMPRNTEFIEDVQAAWDEQVYEFLMNVGLNDADRVLDKYKALRNAKTLAIEDYLGDLRARGVNLDGILAIDDAMEVSELTKLYLVKLKELFGSGIYNEYAKLRKTFNVQMQNITRQDDPLYQIDF